MAILSGQSQNSLNASLWRIKTILKGNKKAVFCADPMFFIFLINLILVSIFTTKKDLNITADSAITVTTNNPINSDNYFYDRSLTTNFSLPNCSLNNQNVIGRVMSSSASLQEQFAVNSIFDALNNAYMLNNPEQPSFTSLLFSDYSELENYLHSRNYINQNNICFAYGFSEFDHKSYSYTFEQYFSWQLLGKKSNVNQTYLGSPYYFIQNNEKKHYTSGFNVFNTSGFQQLMTLATASIIKSIEPSLEPNFTVAYLPMNTGPYSWYNNLQSQLLLIALMMLCKNYVRKLREMIQEEPEIESRVIGMLRLQGFNPSVELLIQWITDAIFLLPLGLFLAVLGIVCTAKNVTFGLYLLLFWMYFIQITLLFSILHYGFGKGMLSKIIILIYVLLQMIVSVFRFLHPNPKRLIMVLQCYLFPQMQLQYFLQFANFKLLNPYVNSEVNITNLSYKVRDLSFATILTIGAFNICIFTVLLIYLWPLYVNTQQEKKLRFYYPLTCSYWCKNKKQISREEPDTERGILNQNIPLLSVQIENELQLQEQLLVEQGKIEPLRGDESKKRLVITELVKKFGNLTAVNKLSMTLFQDQILVLLGHNGAGKTTTIDMLTGMQKPTSGAAKAFGIDLFEGKTSSNFISVCHQHNVLLFKMSVFENLQFFCKNNGTENIDERITEMLRIFRMTDKKDNTPDQLSGGQKRKLSLMISLCTNAKIILLDEPTSGMDPTTRREIWSILKKLKSGKILIMTTHYMDEAEQLGDRVAIMSKGQLKCCGSPLFLKNKFSHSFYIVVTQNDNQLELTEFEHLLKKYLFQPDQENSIFKTTDEKSRIVYTVPKEFGKKFQSFFIEVDLKLVALNIKEYSVRTSSLEEVFAQIGENEKNEINNTIQSVRIPSLSDTSHQRTELGEKSTWRTFKALLGLNLKSNIGFFISLFVLSCISALYPTIYIAFANAKQPVIKLSSVPDVFKGESLPLQAFVNDQNSGIFSNFNAEYINLQQLQFTPGNTITETLQSWANSIQNQAVLSGATVYGSYFVANVPDSLQTCQPTETQNCQFSVAVYGNLTSISSQNVFGATVLSQIAQQYTNIPELKIKFNNQATTNRGSPNTAFVTNFVVTFAVATMYLTLLFTGEQMNRIDSYYFMLLLTKSGSRYLYVGSLLFILIVLHSILLAAYEGIYFFMLLLPRGIWVAGLIFMLTDTVFVLLIAYYFVVIRKSEWVFLLILISYFLSIAAIAPERLLYSDKQQVHFIGILILLPLTCYPPIGFTSSFAAWWSRQKVAQSRSVSTDSIGNYEIQKWFMIAMTFWLFVYSLLLYLIVTGKICRSQVAQDDLSASQTYSEDPQVKKERERLKNQSNHDEIVRCVELVKKYDYNHKKAVNGVSFGVSQGECFALLGLAGAGKTTTLNMILGQELISGGQCTIQNQDLKPIYNQPEKLHGLVGYCPQINSIEKTLTVKDSLWYLCEMIGVRKDTVEDVVRNTIARFDLTDYTNTRAGVLSGGNKRKLCCAQAMLGNPKAIFIDEASTGVDPVARRKIWQAMQFEAANSALILTTHTMEEAEILATKIGIMVGGKLKCFGTLQHIQDTQSNGYEIEMNLQLDKLHSNLVEIEPSLQYSNDISLIIQQLFTWQSMLFQDRKKIGFTFAEEFSRNGIFNLHKKHLIQLKS